MKAVIDMLPSNQKHRGDQVENRLPSGFFLDLATRGTRMPIGTELVLSEKPDTEAIKRDGLRLGQVVEESARRWRTPLALPLMDLTVEKEWLCAALGVPAPQIATWHFSETQPPDTLPDTPLTSRLIANNEAIRYLANCTDMVPCGMSIGPFSLMTKLIADPISPVFLAGMDDRDDDVERIEKVLELATQTILYVIGTQIDAGAKAIVVCEPAANTVYFSPNQLAGGTDIFDRYVMDLNLRISRLLKSRGVALIFHDCGDLTDDLVRKFAVLDPAMLSLGSSRRLWEDAALLPETIVLYGNLPTKKFYSDEVMSIGQVRELGGGLVSKMRATGHPFILGSECDVLSVRGAEETIRAKVAAFMHEI